LGRSICVGRAVAVEPETLMKNAEMTKHEIQDKLKQINRMIGDVGENAVADYMLEQGWRPLYSSQLNDAMMQIGVQEHAEESPERFIDRAFWRYSGLDSLDHDGDVEWELIQVKTTCVESPGHLWLSVCLPPNILDRYLRYTKRAINVIRGNGLTCPFPKLTKFNLYIVNPDGVFCIDILDVEKYSARTNRSNVLRIDRSACDGVVNWSIDERPRYNSLCDERRYYHRLLENLQRNPRQIPLHLGGVDL
jgi:hypothetical protein